VPTIRDAIELVARNFELLPDQLRGPSKKQPLALARQVAMWVAREATGSSYPRIARELGGRDHTTIIYGCRAVAKLVAGDALFAEGLRRIVVAVRECAPLRPMLTAPPRRLPMLKPTRIKATLPPLNADRAAWLSLGGEMVQ
jgi:hypothetical protein